MRHTHLWGSYLQGIKAGLLENVSVFLVSAVLYIAISQYRVDNERCSFLSLHQKDH